MFVENDEIRNFEHLSTKKCIKYLEILLAVLRVQCLQAFIRPSVYTHIQRQKIETVVWICVGYENPVLRREREDEININTGSVNLK